MRLILNIIHKLHKTKIRESYGSLLTYLFLTFSTITYSQTTEWFAPLNSSSWIETNAITVDKEGSVYTLGKFSGEFNLNAALGTEGQINAYASTSMPRVFLTKHTQDGQLSFLVEIDSRYGNSHLPYAQDVKELTNGNIAVLIRMDADYAIIDSQRDTTTIRRPLPCSLLLFSKNGTLQKTYNLPVDYAREIIEMPNGELCFLGVESSYVYGKKQKICRINPLTDQPERIELEQTDFTQIYYYKGQLWCLRYTPLEAPRYQKTGIYTVAILSLITKTMSPVFTKEVSPCYGSSGRLTESGGQLKFVVNIVSNQDKPVTINSATSCLKGKGAGVIVYNELGIQEQAATVSPYFTKVNVTGTEDGGYLLDAVVKDTLIWKDKYTLVVPKHENYISELLFAKLYFDLTIDWIVEAGGCNTSQAKFDSALTFNHLYIASQLIGTSNFDFGTYEPTWKTVLPVRKININATP